MLSKNKTIAIFLSVTLVLIFLFGCSEKETLPSNPESDEAITTTSALTTTTDAHSIDIASFYHITLPETFRMQYQFGTIEKIGNDFLDSCYDGWIFYKNEGGNVYRMYTLYDKNDQWKDQNRLVGLDSILGDYILFLKAPQAKQTEEECEMKGAFCTKYIDESTNYEYWINEKTGLVFKATMKDSNDSFVEIIKWETPISDFEIQIPA